MHTAQPIAGVAPTGIDPAVSIHRIVNRRVVGYDYRAGVYFGACWPMARNCDLRVMESGGVQSILRRVKTCILYCTPGYPTESSYAPLTRRDLRAGTILKYQQIANSTLVVSAECLNDFRVVGAHLATIPRRNRLPSEVGASRYLSKWYTALLSRFFSCVQFCQPISHWQRWPPYDHSSAYRITDFDSLVNEANEYVRTY